ncbi:MAG: tetratricopeptide repeat protein [Bacteroidota bacterium]
MLPLIPAFIQQQLDTGQLHGRLEGFALNIDLSGFAPLTNNLMEAGRQGAEELSQILNDIFRPLVSVIYDNGGFIPYFAGDAFTAIFPLPPDERSAMHLLWVASEARRSMIEREGGFGGFTIGLKAGLAYGAIHYGVVGEQLKASYFKGPAVEQSSNCQAIAQINDIVIADRVVDILAKRNLASEWVSDQSYRVLEQSPGIRAAVKPLDLPPVKEETASQFLPESVVRKKIPGEFRTVVSTFIAFEGIHTHDQLSDFATRVLNRVLDFGGYFKEIDFGDKGALMVAFFGAPVSYENNLIRALEYGEAIRQEVGQIRQNGQPLRFRMGISQGTAFTGIMGGAERCQYACIGRNINLAARLMSGAEWQQILVDPQVARSEGFQFQAVGENYFKGFTNPLTTYVLQGHRRKTGKPSYEGPIVGRQEEIGILKKSISSALDNHNCGLAYVYGEAGIGKSRFTDEVRKQLSQERELKWFFCPSDQILRKSFNPFIYFLLDYFEQSGETDTGLRIAHFDAICDRIHNQLDQDQRSQAKQAANELVRTKSILKALVGLPTENTLWERLDARGRYQNTVAAIINLFVAESLIQAVVIELEDIHWLDDDSKQLLRDMPWRIVDLPIYILCSSRYTDAGERPKLWQADPIKARVTPLEVDLNALSRQAVREYAEFNLGGPISDTFYELLLKASNRNPFYLEQLLGYFRENELLIQENGEWAPRDGNIELSESINSILTARIDRLSNLVRETVKAAAVIGREFDLPVLQELIIQQADELNINQTDLQEQVRLAEQGQIWSAVNELRYIFRHSLLRDAVYSMQLHTRLQELHRQIAEVIERLYTDNIETHYVDLAYHYEQAGDTDRTIEFLQKAADFARSNYQNQLALDLYERLLAKPVKDRDNPEKVRIQLSRGQVLEIVGRWEESLAVYREAQHLAKRSRDVILLGKANSRLGHLLMLRGRYEEAMQFLQIASGLFESIDDPLGIAKVYGHLGLLYFRRAKYNQALDYFQRSMETGFSQVGTTNGAEIVSYLGLTYMNQGEYQQGIELIKNQIPLHEANQDSMGLANLHVNLGIIFFESGDDMAAESHFDQGLQLAEELGNKQLQAIGLGSLGRIFERRGEYDRAMDLFKKDLTLCKELGDWQGIAIAEGLIGELYSLRGKYELAEQHLDHYLNISRDLGYQKGVAKAINSLGDICYYQKRFEDSVNYYDQSIEIARKTNNVPVLGNSLMEKGVVLLSVGKLEELEEVLEETLKIAQELQQPDLLFSTHLLEARTKVERGQVREGLSQIQDLLDQLDLRPEQQAAAYYERFRISSRDTEAHDMAFALYTKLYEEAPKALYRNRLDALNT